MCQLKNLEFKQQCGKIGGLYLLAYLAPGYLGGLKFHSFKAYILQALKRGERRSSEHLAALGSKEKVVKKSVRNPSMQGGLVSSRTSILEEGKCSNLATPSGP